MSITVGKKPDVALARLGGGGVVASIAAAWCLVGSTVRLADEPEPVAGSVSMGVLGSNDGPEQAKDYRAARQA